MPEAKGSRPVNAERTEALFRRGGELRVEANRLNEAAARFFREYEEWQANVREEGTQVDFLMEPPLEAAYGAWKTRGAHDRRLELTQLPEAPLQ